MTLLIVIEKQQKLVEEQWEAACQVLKPTTLKVLHGFQEMSLIRGSNTFAASLDEVAIQAGVETPTVIRHRAKLLRDGWLHYVFHAGPGHLASTYTLCIPRHLVSTTAPLITRPAHTQADLQPNTQALTTEADICVPLNRTGIRGGSRL
jgi:hypothetical protein